MLFLPTRRLTLAATAACAMLPTLGSGVAVAAPPTAVELDTGFRAAEIGQVLLADTGAVVASGYNDDFTEQRIGRYRAGRLSILTGLGGSAVTNNVSEQNRLGVVVGTSNAFDGAASAPTAWLPFGDSPFKLPGSKTGDQIEALNDFGQTLITHDPDRSPALLSPNGRRTEVTLPAGFQTSTGYLNNRAQVLWAGVPAGSDYGRGVLWQNGAAIYIGAPTSLPATPPFPPANITVGPTALNDRGEIAGYVNAFPNNPQYAFLRSAGGTFTVIGTPDANATYEFPLLTPIGHVVVGYAPNGDLDSPTHIALWTGARDGSIRDLGRGRPIAVNSRDQIVGTDATDNPAEAFYWSASTGFVTLRSAIPGATLVTPTAINEFGQIAGIVEAPDGKHVVRWSIRR